MSLRVNKWLKFLTGLLILGSILATVKVILVDYTLDEEYQVVMAYRRLSGDALFGAMWEPHQTSSFACAWLMRFFAAVTGGTDGVVIFLRVFTAVIQFLLSVWLYQVLSRFLKKEYAFLLGTCYFNMIPKIIQIPEFSNLQVWFFTVIVLALLQYYDAVRDTSGKKGAGVRRLWLVVSGLGMAFEVLAYPSSLVLFFFFLICIFCESKKRKGHISAGVRDCMIFAGTCAVSALIWLWRVLSAISLEEFLRNVKYTVNFDLTHDMSLTAETRMTALVRDMKTLAVLLLVIVVLAFALWWVAGVILKRKRSRIKRDGIAVFSVFMILAAEAVQLFYWLVPKKGYEEPQIHLFVILAAAALVWRKAGDIRKTLSAGFFGGILTILAVIYMSDMGIWYALPHGMPGVLFGLAILAQALEDGYSGQGGRFWTCLLLFSLAFVSVFGKGFTLRAGNTATNSVLGVGGVIRHGPSAGIFTNYMQAYITNSTYEEFQEYVAPGTNCLIVTNMVGSAGTSPYLFTGANVSHFSVVDPTSYDERLLTYWELYPEKYPDVIVVDCWYGELKEDPDSWIMRYIENGFGYTETVDGKFVRYYFREPFGAAFPVD